MTTKEKNFSLAIHGGAGASARQLTIGDNKVEQSLYDIVDAGRKILADGGTALETVKHCVMLLENDPIYNAGYGAIANKEGNYELDAAIMDGFTLKAGAVAAVKNIKNPVVLAERVKDKTEHLMIVGQGAMEFAAAENIETADKTYFEQAHKDVDRIIEETHGTVGAVARDIHGNLAAATSTGGWVTKMPGRVGDTPLIGSGTFADNMSCAVSCTGCGEDFIRTRLAGYAAALIELKGLDATAAATEAIHYLVNRVKGVGGFILIDKDGNVAITQAAPIMRCGWTENDGPIHASLQAPIRAQSH